MKKFRGSLCKTGFLMILFSLSFFRVEAQVTASVAVLPPYSPNIEDYADKTRITVLALDFNEMQCNLRLTIKGDNGIEMVSSSDYFFSTFTVQNAVPVILTGPDLTEYFDLNHLIVSGIDPSELQSDGLPAGNYSICAQVYNEGRALSGDAPSGCSNYFRVNYMQPPMLISPANESVIENTLTQQIIFSWTPSPGAPLWTSYILKIVEIADPSQDPHDAMLTATTPAFFEEEVHGTSFLYGPAQPLLDPGKRYAFQVIASDLETKSKFENFGRSEVWSFQFGKEEDNILYFNDVTEVFTPPMPKVTSEPKSWTIPNSSISGVMQYFFPQDQATKGFLENIPLKLRIGYYLLTANNEKVYLENSLWDYEYEQDVKVGAGNLSAWYKAVYAIDTLPDLETEVSFCTTDDDGEFIFMFNNPGMGLVASKITATRTTPPINIGDDQIAMGTPGLHHDGKIEIFKGDLYMYATIIVDNDYYASPDKELLTGKGDHENAGVINTKVRSYDLKVNVKADKSFQGQYKQDNIESMVVYILRGNQPLGVPLNEGKGSQPVEAGEKLFNMRVLAKEITNNVGVATLRNLVKNVYGNPYDRYFIYATALASSDVNYSMDAPVLFNFGHPADNAEYSYEYALPSPVPVKELIAKPLPPAIRGSVYRYDNQMEPVKDAHVQLFNMSYIVNSEITMSDGKFSFDLPGSKEGDKWALFVTHTGFKAKYVQVPYSLILGKKYVREDILLEPEATINGTVINEKGEGVRVHIRMDDGAYKEFQPFCPDLQINSAMSPQTAASVISGSSTQSVKDFSATIYPGSNSGTILQNNSQKVLSGIGNQAQKASSKPVITAGTLSAMPLAPPCTAPTPFTLYSTSGNHKLIIDPVDPGYLNDTIDVLVQKNSNSLSPITVYTKKHRIQVSVREKVSSGSISVGNPVANAKVTVEGFATGITNNLGLVSFEFTSSSDTIKLYVEGPDQKDYIPQVKTVVADESKTFRNVTVSLKPGGRIKGTVYAGVTDSSAVASARVYVDIPGEVKIETKSDAQGKYDLRNVPADMKIIIRAVKSASNFVGDSLTVMISMAKAGQTGILDGVNFHLKVFNDMDISKLLGFPIEVTRLTIGGAGGNDVLISGNFTNIPSNECFSLPAGENSMRFNNVSIIPSPYLKNDKGVPLSQPKNNKVTTNKNKLGVNLFKNYKADLVGDQLLGLEVVDISKGTGAIAARVKFNLSSLTTSLISFNEEVWLSQGTGGTMKLPAFSTEPGYVNYPAGLRLSDVNGGPLSFTFDDLTLEAAVAKSVVRGDSVILNAVLHTNFKNIPSPDAKLGLGKMIFVKDASQQVTFKNIYGKDLIIPLSQSSMPWSLNVSSWTLGQSNGLQFISGYINTGIVTVPFNNIFVEQYQDSTVMKGGQYKLDQLSLANIVTLNINGQKQFGYDKGRHAWKLSVSGQPGQPCAWFGGLPGMAQGDKVEIENFFFLSNSNPIFNLSQNSKPLTLYNIGTFTPGLITVINNDIAIAGMIDYHIPDMNNGNKIDYKIFYFKKDDNSIAFRNEVAGFLITPPGPVTMEFFPVTGTQTLDEKGFYAKGKIYQKNASDKIFEFDAWLYRTTDSISMIVDKSTNQKFMFSGNSTLASRLENVKGRMYVEGGAWNPFRFSGDLKGKGTTGSMAFNVQYDLAPESQDIIIENIPGSFSNIGNLTYDFANKSFTGVIDFSQTLGGGAAFSASAEVLFDPTGWYFLGLGSLSIPTPSMSGNASIFIGSYSVNQHIIDKFIPNSRVYKLFGEPPANFPALNDKFSGFYIEGGISIPIPIIPQFEFDLGVISAQLSHEIGSDIRLSMNFNEGTTVHAGVSIFARITAGVGASVVIACANSTVTGKALISADGLYSTNGSWSATGYAEFGISGSTELGAGACDASCDGIFGVGPCVVSSASASKSLFGKFSISDKGTDFEFGFK